MDISDFDFELPDDLIARYPAERRRDSRLLVLDPARQSISDRTFADLPSLLAAGDLLVLNDTRVIPARLFGRKESGGKVEILVERLLDDNEALVLIRASKSPRPGAKIRLAGDAIASVVDRHRDLYRLKFSVDPGSVLEEFGSVPLPPYLDREAEAGDRDRYQCVYAREPGAVAAPTAGLHFDQEMLDELAAAGVQSSFVTLHVGSGTFQALREQEVEANRLHSERVTVPLELCEAVADCRRRGGRVLAVGTTTVRALEAASSGGELRPFDGETSLFIYPGYRFRCVDAMLTNFHLPRSSLLMLVAAFAGREFVLGAYRHAVNAGYRFFSYGDAMLVQNRI
jgi:S-adenosylmethionine:tRNA ribosyltransferase-isomerase